jgi:hypothetical protein
MIKLNAQGNEAETIQRIHVLDEPTHRFEHKMKLDRERMLNSTLYYTVGGPPLAKKKKRR